MDLFKYSSKKFPRFKKNLTAEHFTFFKKDPKTNFHEFSNNFFFPEKTYSKLLRNKAGLLFIQFIIISLLAYASKHTTIENLNNYLTILVFACQMPMLIRLFKYITVMPTSWASQHLEETYDESKRQNLSIPLIADFLVGALSISYMLFWFN